MRRRRKKSGARRQAELAAYREMVGRIERGEVRRLLWKGREHAVEVKAGGIYVVEPGLFGHGTATRYVTAGGLARDFAELPKEEDHWAM